MALYCFRYVEFGQEVVGSDDRVGVVMIGWGW